MNTDPKLVTELQRLFLDGATPSRLMQYILEQHPVKTKSEKYHLIKNYFKEAFCISFIANLCRDESYDSGDLRYSFLNEGLLHKIVVNQAKWNLTPNLHPVGTPDWLDTLNATSDEEQFKAAQSTVPQELPCLWQKLDSKEKEYICRLSANLSHVYERSRILARLAERLQVKVAELEKRLEEKK